MSQYPISYVSAETGINPITLRAWENRYQLIIPTRTPSGHRLYSSQDIDRIKKILYLKSKGHRMTEMRALLNKHPDTYNATIQHAIPHVIEYTKNFEAKALCHTLKKLLTTFSIEEFADKVYPIILDVLKKALWQNSIYFTMERCFFFDQLRNTLLNYYETYEQDYKQLQIKIIGYEAPKEISEFYIKNLFLAIQCSQFHLNTCLINHIDLFDEIIETATLNPQILHVSSLGNNAYQFRQCIHVIVNENLQNIIFYHPTIDLTDLSPEQVHCVLPQKHEQMMGFINRRLALLGY